MKAGRNNANKYHVLFDGRLEKSFKYLIPLADADQYFLVLIT